MFETEERKPADAPLPGDLGELRGEAAADATASAKPGDTPAPDAPVVAAETWEDWRDAIVVARAWAVGPYPALAAVYTDGNINQLAQAIFAVCKKRGWSLAFLWIAWKEEITLLLIAGPLLRDTARIVKAGKGKAAAPEVAAPGASAAPPPEGALKPNTGA